MSLSQENSFILCANSTKRLHRLNNVSNLGLSLKLSLNQAWLDDLIPAKPSPITLLQILSKASSILLANASENLFWLEKKHLSFRSIIGLATASQLKSALMTSFLNASIISFFPFFCVLYVKEFCVLFLQQNCIHFCFHYIHSKSFHYFEKVYLLSLNL